MMLMRAQPRTHTDADTQKKLKRAQRNRHKCPSHARGNYDKVRIEAEKGGDLLRQTDWRWMKQEDGLFGGLFSAVAADSLHRFPFSYIQKGFVSFLAKWPAQFSSLWEKEFGF